MVSADAWRWPLPRHDTWRARRHAEIPRASRQGRGRLRLLRRAAADRSILRGFVDRRLRPRAAHRASALPRRRTPRPAIARRRRTHDGHARPYFQRPVADQRRHRRRPGREQGRRHLPQPRRPLRRHRRVPPGLHAPPVRRDLRLPRQAHPGRGQQDPVPARAAAASGALFRRLLAGRPGRGGKDGPEIPHLGRTARGRRREGGAHEGVGRASGPGIIVRHPPARDRARDQRGKPGARPPS